MMDAYWGVLFHQKRKEQPCQENPGGNAYVTGKT